jgi:iron complex transport system substrate-binding protein
MLHRRSAFGLAAALASALTAAVSPARAAVSARDDLNTVVRLPRPAGRIVSLTPNVTEMLFAIGAGKQVVGRTTFCDYPPEAKRKPALGGLVNPDVEKVVALKPDLVIVARLVPRDVQEQIKRRRIPVFALDARRWSDIQRHIGVLGTLTGREREAARLRKSLDTRLRAVATKVAGRPRPKVMVVANREPLIIAGAGSFIGDAVRMAGGTPVTVAGRADWPVVNGEQVLAANPEVIVLPGGSAADLAQVREMAGVRHTAAVRAERVISGRRDELLRPGPRLVAAVEALARLLHPSAFPAKP